MSQNNGNSKPPAPEKAPDTREWTLMFYFASDNPLAPAIVSQLKAIKNAGFHQDVNVIAQFDPQVEGMPTHIFDVNGVNKQRRLAEFPKRPNHIGFAGDNPEVRNLVLDKLWRNEENSEGKQIKERVREYLASPDEGPKIDYQAPNLVLPSTATRSPIGQKGSKNGQNGEEESTVLESLTAFLNVCAQKFPARHYMLFILGHGLVVGNDLFMFDEHPRGSVRLEELGIVLEDFNKQIEPKGGELELLGLHSCSMSSVEVVYQLQGKVNYLLASQGPAHVGSWPYREMLIRIFNNQKLGSSSAAIAKTINQMFEAILYASFDFQLAGYSFDICLMNLKRDLSPLTTALEALCETLIKALKQKNPIARHVILLAHLEAQSFYQETYTDLFDFCACLKRRCKETLPYSNGASGILEELKMRCRNVRLALKKKVGDEPRLEAVGAATDDKVILRQTFVGPESQYAHGLSVFFPWAEPLESQFWKDEYQNYKFNRSSPAPNAPSPNSWMNFLETYFEATRRDPIRAEQEVEAKNKEEVMPPQDPGILEELLEEVTVKMFNESEHLGPSAETLGPGDKAGGESVMGLDSRAPIIKNYPSFTRQRRRKSADPSQASAKSPAIAKV